MKTAKRNARTTKIFNNVMDAITKVYGINEHMTLKDIYEVMLEKDGLKFQFLDTNGKIIYNTFGVAKNSLNIGRRLTFSDSDKYIEASIHLSEDYKDGLININQFDYDECDNASPDDCINFDNFLFTSNIINSRLLSKLIASYTYEYYKNKDYKARICFETIFGYQFLSRKEFDRIRYIYFSNDVFYDVMGGYFCFHEFIYTVTKNLMTNCLFSFDYKTRFLSVVLFPLIKNAIVSKEYYTDERLMDEYKAISLKRGGRFFNIKKEFQFKNISMSKVKKIYSSNIVTKEEINIIKEDIPTKPFVCRSVPANDSGKIASKYGDKSVISKVIDDELMSD